MDLLFYSKDGSDAFRAQIEAAIKEVNRLSQDRVLNTDPDKLADYFSEKYSVEVPVLDLENITFVEQETQINVRDRFSGQDARVPGTALIFDIPFSGDHEIFFMRPNTFDSGPPSAEIIKNVLRFSISGRNLTEDAGTRQYERNLESIQKYLGWHETLWSGFDNQLRTTVLRSIEARKERLLKQKSLASKLTSLGVKLVEKPGDPQTVRFQTIETF